jgi:hypothetical protein
MQECDANEWEGTLLLVETAIAWSMKEMKNSALVTRWSCREVEKTFHKPHVKRRGDKSFYVCASVFRFVE